MADKKDGNGKKPEENKGSSSIPGALGKKAFQFAKENPGAAAAGAAFLLVGGWIPAAIAGAAASERGRKVIGSVIPDSVKGVAKQGFEQVGNLKKGLEDTFGQGEPEAPAEEEKPAAKKPGGGRKGPKGLGPK